MNTVSVSRRTLEEWALCLGQGDISPRWEIEALLTQPEQPEAGRGEFTGDQAQLARFYVAETKDELIATQAHHVEKLQTKMHALRASIVALAAVWDAMAKNHDHLMRITDSSVIMAEHRTAAHMFRERAAELRQLAEGNSAAAQEGL